MIIHSLEWKDNKLYLLDQTRLPGTYVYLEYSDYLKVADAIKNLVVRGAPAIGIAAAYGMLLAYQNLSRDCQDIATIEKRFLYAADTMKMARPTAVNLFWAVDEMIKVFKNTKLENIYGALLRKANEIERQDKEICSRIADQGADIFKGKKHLKILTHCNAGALATAGIGTALGVITRLHQHGQLSCAYVNETRPLLQGARLTAAELVSSQIPVRLISDSMAADVMKRKKIDAVIVGADRIAGNGDTANKIGTYGIAVLCKYHQIPFYVAAPFSTFDFSISSGKDIPIEERNPDEVRMVQGIYIAPKNIPVYNPSFDITPNELITGIITEKGALKAPYYISIKQFERSLKYE